MNETRYLMTVTGDATILAEFARVFGSRSRDDADDIFDEVRIPSLPSPLIGFSDVRVWNTEMHEDKLHVTYVGGDRYDTRPGETLAAAHPEMEIAVTACRELEWEVGFLVTYRNGRQATPWQIHQNRASAGSPGCIAEIVAGDRRLGATVRYRDTLMGEEREGVITSINDGGETEIGPIGPLYATTLKSLKELGEPENDSRHFPTTINRRMTR